MRRGWLAAVMMVLAIGCSSTPSEFTHEGWERIQREDPNKAQVAKWIHRSPQREDLMRIWIGREGEMSQQVYEINLNWFYQMAQEEMLSGKKGALKTAVIASLVESRGNILSYSEDTMHSQEERDKSKAKLPILDKALSEVLKVK